MSDKFGASEFQNMQPSAFDGNLEPILSLLLMGVKKACRDLSKLMQMRGCLSFIGVASHPPPSSKLGCYSPPVLDPSFTCLGPQPTLTRIVNRA